MAGEVDGDGRLADTSSTSARTVVRPFYSGPKVVAHMSSDTFRASMPFRMPDWVLPIAFHEGELTRHIVNEGDGTRAGGMGGPSRT